MLDEVHAWVTHPRMHRNVDLCSLWLGLREHWPLLVTACRDPDPLHELLAACGGTVAKHGNRAQSSKCGSADVLEALGIAIDGEPAAVERCLRDAGIAFAFAPRFHAATRHAAGARRELGTRTIFNLLGPLTNPAHVRHQVVGVYAKQWCEPMAAALGALGVRRAAVVHAASGLDELAVRGPTHVAIFAEDVVLMHELAPRHFGCDEIDPVGLAGGDATHNAIVLRATLAGQLVGHGEPHEAFLQAAAMTAALGLCLLAPGKLDLSKLADALHLARRTRKVVRQNLVLSFAVLAVLVPGALFGVLNLPVAVAGHELSELAVILSGLRLARAGRD